MRQRFIITDETRGSIVWAINTIKGDGSYQVEIKPYRKNRTLAQLSLYWVWMKEISSSYSDSHGELHAPDVFHQYFKRLFLGQVPVEISGNKMVAMSSTSKLNTKDMANYMEAIEHWAGAELECQLSHPEDTYNEAMGQ